MPFLPAEIKKVLIDGDQIGQHVVEMGSEITRDCRSSALLFIAILRGASVFHADLIRHVDLKLSS